ncbi:MAG: ABC transporter substrate-binding protein [Nitrospinota bacterium]|nr:ABC transporter substrate-binding protein [Nitrospinota bacterium]
MCFSEKAVISVLPSQWSARACPAPSRPLRLAVLTIALAVALTGCERKPEPPLRVGTNTWPGYELLYLAKHLGLYKGKSLDVIRYPSSSDSMTAFRNGLIEAVAVTLDEALLLQSEGQRIRLVLLFDFSNGGDVIIGRPGLESIRDLEMKKVGVENTALGAYMLTRALEESGMSLDRITIVPLKLNQHEKAYTEKTVDAVVTFEPVRSRLLEAGGRILFHSGQIPGEIIDVLAVREDVATKRPTLVRRMVRAYFQAFDYMENNRRESIGYMARMENIPKDAYTKSLEGIRLIGKDENSRLLDPANEELVSRLKVLERIMREKQLLLSDTNPASLPDGSFVN